MSNNETWTTRVRTFTDSNNMNWTVMSTRAMRQRVDGWTARAENVRTFARRDSDDVEVDMEAGCGYQAERVVREFNEAS